VLRPDTAVRGWWGERSGRIAASVSGRSLALKSYDRCIGPARIGAMGTAKMAGIETLLAIVAFYSLIFLWMILPEAELA
jgi:hypothetical protein